MGGGVRSCTGRCSPCSQTRPGVHGWRRGCAPSRTGQGGQQGRQQGRQQGQGWAYCRGELLKVGGGAALGVPVASATQLGFGYSLEVAVVARHDPIAHTAPVHLIPAASAPHAHDDLLELLVALWYRQLAELALEDLPHRLNRVEVGAVGHVGEQLKVGKVGRPVVEEGLFGVTTSTILQEGQLVQGGEGGVIVVRVGDAPLQHVVEELDRVRRLEETCVRVGRQACGVVLDGRAAHAAQGVHAGPYCDAHVRPHLLVAGATRSDAKPNAPLAALWLGLRRRRSWQAA